ncbi:MAG: cupredoxin family copper-binding protein [Gemmatimonadota bacterium]
MFGPNEALAQPLTERTPNLEGTWITSPRVLHFQFAHRFQVVGNDADIADIFDEGKIVNYPTFEIDYGLLDRAMIGVRYSSNSLIGGQVNEWQPFVKVAPIQGVGSGKISLALTAAWNNATHSADGEISAQTTVGPLILISALRGFSDIYDLPDSVSDEALALAGGLGIKINRYITLAGDVGDVVSGPDGPAAWSAGLHLGIPFTPHTFSIMATNVTSGTLEGTSTGLTDTVFWGFEFTVPFSGFARWGRIFSPEELGTGAGGEEAVGGAGRRHVVEVAISRLAFRRPQLEVPVGTTVRWVNKDPVAHTSTSDAAVWGSTLIGPGETYEFTFRKPGRYPYHCVPHPFMTAVVIVKAGG